MIERIIFIYNADAGVLAAALDSARKLAGSEDACALCSITHGLLTEKTEWRDIECGLGAPTAYYHRDDTPDSVRRFLEENQVQLPVVLLGSEASAYEVAVGSSALQQCKGDPWRLMQEIQAAMEASTAT